MATLTRWMWNILFLKQPDNQTLEEAVKKFLACQKQRRGLPEMLKK